MESQRVSYQTNGLLPYQCIFHISMYYVKEREGMDLLFLSVIRIKSDLWFLRLIKWFTFYVLLYECLCRVLWMTCIIWSIGQ